MQQQRLKILFVASEMEPLAKIGGLADVIGTLPKRLVSLGCEVRVIIPYYNQVKSNLKKLGIKPKTLDEQPLFCIDWLPHKVEVKEVDIHGVPVYLLCNEELFQRDSIYSTPKGEYADNDLRFGFLSLGALELAKALGYQPDIIHCHDWETALIPICLKWRKHLKDDPFFENTKTVFTIHNISYQGQFERELLDKFGLPGFLFTSQGLELYGKVNLLKGAILYSDLVTTVSPTYAVEIKKREYSYGLDAVLKWVSRDGDNLIGILNGIDYEEWDPQTDGKIYQTYSLSQIEQKAKNKAALIEELGLSTEEDKPLLGMVTKLNEQKGLDLFIDSLPQIFDLGFQVALLGQGSEKYENLVRKARRKYSKNLSVTVGLDDELERKIYSASDAFLMPSQFEPCGLGQIIALRYGTIPIVRGTGGLLDTVRDYTEEPDVGNGFVFHEFSKVSMLSALIRALSVWDNHSEWATLIERAMKEDYSWRNSGKEYINIYNRIISQD